MEIKNTCRYQSCCNWKSNTILSFFIFLIETFIIWLVMDNITMAKVRSYRRVIKENTTLVAAALQNNILLKLNNSK